MLAKSSFNSMENNKENPESYNDQPPIYNSVDEVQMPQMPTRPSHVVESNTTTNRTGETIDRIRTYMRWSIINTLCFGLLLGLIGCLFLHYVQDYKVARNAEKARKWSRIALWWNIFSTLIGIGITVALVVNFIVKSKSRYSGYSG